MTRQDDEQDSTSQDTSRDGTMSRRQVLTTAGLAAAGAGLAAARPSAAPAANTSPGPVGAAPQGTTAVEFRARFAQTGQTGEDFVAYGYLTRADGVGDDDLFAGSPQSDTTALLTAYAEGQLVGRTTDQAVHALDIQGTLTVYQRPGPGASFADPGSFQAGTPVARFELTLQDIVTVFAPGKGLPTLTGDMRQTDAGPLGGDSRGRRFGHVGARARLFATGMGTLTDPARLNSVLEMAGNWTAK